MKIRIKGNSLRLRLSQTEVAQIQKDGEVSDKIDFGFNNLTYSLVNSSDKQTTVSFQNNEIKVLVAKERVTQWFNTEEIGISEVLILPNDTTLSLLIEKDFQCLTERKGEDESDLFKNPAQAH